MTYETLLLDFDHTLFDSDTSERLAVAETLRASGVEDPAPHLPVYRRINEALWASVARGRLTPEAVRIARFERLVTELGLDADPAAMAVRFTRALAAHGDLYPGAREVLERLAGSAALALVTNGLADVQRERLRRLELEPLFDAVVISTEVGASKPDFRIFAAALERLGCPARRTTLVVGDSLEADVRGGADFGVATCWYNPRALAGDGAWRATHEIAALEELPALAIGR